MTLTLVTSENNGFEKIETAWNEQCQSFGEDFADYATPALDHAKKIINDGVNGQDYAIYANIRDGEYDCIMHVNCTNLPKVDGKTQKVMWVLLAPKYDYEDVDPQTLAAIASDIIHGAIGLCENGKRSRHVKIHLNNIGDRRFFLGVAYGLKTAKELVDVAVRGNWLHLTLA